jgi:hypothetical protein
MLTRLLRTSRFVPPSNSYEVMNKLIGKGVSLSKIGVDNFSRTNFRKADPLQTFELVEVKTLGSGNQAYSVVKIKDSKGFVREMLFNGNFALKPADLIKMNFLTLLEKADHSIFMLKLAVKNKFNNPIK